MNRTQFDEVACSIARATDLFGDPWMALIMRDVFIGVTRFDDLVEDLGISRKVLAARLSRLVSEDVLVRERYQDHPPREHYTPTEKGKELYPVLLALMAWGDRWYSAELGPPARIHHLDCDRDTTPVTSCAHCGGELTVDNTTQMPGPGGKAGPGTRLIAQLIAARGATADKPPMTVDASGRPTEDDLS